MFKLTVLLLSLILLSTSFAKNFEHEHKEHHHPNPTWTFKADKTKGSVPLLVTFDANKLREAKKFYWDFGNGETLITKNSIVSYEYKAPGTYTASLKFTVDHSEKKPKELKNGGSKIISVINLPPTASLACSVNYLLVNCNGFGSIEPENQPLQYTFTYADGFTESNTTGLSSHAFALAGLYQVELTVKDSYGLASSSTIAVQTVKPPNKLPALALNCSSDKINILKCDASGSVDPDGTIASFSYAWDDGMSDSKADATAIEHTFAAPGEHSITMTAVDNEGGVSSLSKNFIVRANKNPIASFTCDNSKPQKLACHSTSIDPDPEDVIRSYEWKFGGNSIATMTPDADYFFSNGGSFFVNTTGEKSASTEELIIRIDGSLHFGRII